MWKINKDVVIPTPATNKKIFLALDAHLLAQAENYLQAQWAGGDFTHRSLSDLLKKALQAYQRGMPLSVPRSPTTNPKKNITPRFSGELLTFYYTLPLGHRTAILERSLATYLISR